MSVTHIASFPVEIKGRLIQRCAWCGAKIIDTDLRRIMVPDGEEAEPYPTWEPGSFVTVDGNLSSSNNDVADGDLPADSCYPLVEGNY